MSGTRECQPLGTSSIPFHGVSVNAKLWNVILIFGWFFLIRSKISVGSRKGRMTRRFSGLVSGPPPIVEASLVDLEVIIAGYGLWKLLKV